MANVIIGIHGLGNKPPAPTLEKWWKMAIIEGLQKHNYKTALPKFEMVYWADILYDKPLDLSEKDEKSPYYIDERYVPGGKELPVENHDKRKKIVTFLNRQLNRIFLNDDLSLNYSFITEAILSKYFSDLEVYYAENTAETENQNFKAKDLINNRLLKMLEKYKGYNIMLVSHSMGTIISFDVLTFLAQHIPVKTFVTIGSPLALPVVIGKIAAEQKRLQNGKTHMITPRCVTEHWYNLSDIHDKVAFNYDLADDFSENSNKVKPHDFLVVNNYEANGERNAHKSYGYLRTPEFSKILDEFIREEKLTIVQKVYRHLASVITQLKAKLFLRKG